MCGLGPHFVLVVSLTNIGYSVLQVKGVVWCGVVSIIVVVVVIVVIVTYLLMMIVSECYQSGACV